MGNKGFHPASWTNQKKVCLLNTGAER